MKTVKIEHGRRFLALVPHRDARLLLRAWSSELFAGGAAGAWHFPWVAPLAALDRAPSREDICAMARALRQSLPPGKKFECGGPVLAGISLADAEEQVFVYGPALDLGDVLPWDGFPGTTAIRPTALGCALMDGPAPSGLPAPPALSFGAAALAGIKARAISGCEPSGCHPAGWHALRWKIGALAWLPRRG